MLKKKWIIIGIPILLIIVLSTISLYIKFERSGKIAVTITSIPKDAIISINDLPSSTGVTYLEPGKYRFSAKKDGFYTYDQIITISENNNSVILTPQPATEEAKRWYQEKVSDLDKKEAYGQQSKSIQKSLDESYPIIRFLPKTDINGPYKIGYSVEGSSNNVFITISYSTPEGREKALRWIRSTGIDPTTLDIRFDNNDFINPITGKDY